jgi:D-lyxose ketol-isomerase
MKRSEINAKIVETKEFLAQQNFSLPAFASWSLNDWQTKGEECREIVDAALGWDVVDFGLDRFDEYGLVLFTIRNGVWGDERYPKRYCEKVLIVGEHQITPDHHHSLKMEDIINRAGGTLCLKLQQATRDGELLDTPVEVSIDGEVRQFNTQQTVCLQPGESITLGPYLHHRFWAKNGMVLAGEVSTVNDDVADNIFIPDMTRFPETEEDEAPLHLLCNDYERFGILQ